MQINQNDSEVELKRSFTIWKDLLKRNILQKNKIKNLIQKIYFNNLTNALNKW